MKYLFFIVLLCMTAGCLPYKNGDNNAPLAYMAAQNIAYSAHAQQQLDLYLPAGRTKEQTAVVMLVHGGGWTAGDKSDFNALNWYTMFTDAGYAVVNINYRLSTATAFHYPAQLDDMDAAINFLEDKAADYRINTNRIFLVGGSAGGHLVLQYAYTRNKGNITALADFFGPTNFAHSSITGNATTNGLVASYLGSSYTSNPALWREASPVYHVVNAVPTIIFQGGADLLVAPVQSSTLRDSLSARQVPYQYVRYPTQGHGWGGADLEDSRVKLFAWLQQHMPL